MYEKSVNERIEQCLKELNIPVEQGIYKGNERKFITYNEIDDRLGISGDDTSQTDIIGVQVHLFLPIDENYLNLKKEIRNKLKSVGFTYPEITMLIEDETMLRHIVFECETIFFN